MVDEWRRGTTVDESVSVTPRGAEDELMRVEDECECVIGERERAERAESMQFPITEFVLFDRSIEKSMRSFE